MMRALIALAASTALCACSANPSAHARIMAANTPPQADERVVIEERHEPSMAVLAFRATPEEDSAPAEPEPDETPLATEPDPAPEPIEDDEPTPEPEPEPVVEEPEPNPHPACRRATPAAFC